MTLPSHCELLLIPHSSTLIHPSLLPSSSQFVNIICSDVMVACQYFTCAVRSDCTMKWILTEVLENSFDQKKSSSIVQVCTVWGFYFFYTKHTLTLDFGLVYIYTQSPSLTLNRDKHGQTWWEKDDVRKYLRKQTCTWVGKVQRVGLLKNWKN